MECPACYSKVILFSPTIGLYCEKCGFNIKTKEEETNNPPPKKDDDKGNCTI